MTSSGLVGRSLQPPPASGPFGHAPALALLWLPGAKCGFICKPSSASWWHHLCAPPIVNTLVESLIEQALTMAYCSYSTLLLHSCPRSQSPALLHVLMFRACSICCRISTALGSYIEQIGCAHRVADFNAPSDA